MGDRRRRRPRQKDRLGRLPYVRAPRHRQGALLGTTEFNGAPGYGTEQHRRRRDARERRRRRPWAAPSPDSLASTTRARSLTRQGALLGRGRVAASATEPTDIGDDETPASRGRRRRRPGGGTHDSAPRAPSSPAGRALLGTRSGWGPLGYGTTKDIGDDETPASAGDVDVGGPVGALSVGSWGDAARSSRTGAVRCWGDNEYGRSVTATRADR